MSPKRSRSDRLADLGFSSDTVAVMGVFPEMSNDADKVRAIFTTPRQGRRG
jgi:hypothetical protein